MLCIASGVFELDLKRVLGVSVLFRGLRFCSIAVLLMWYGEAVVDAIETQFWIASSVLGALVLLGYGAWQWIHSNGLGAIQPAPDR